MSAKRQQPKFAPRHDFATHIEGPLVMDVQNNFIQRWNQAIDDGRLFSTGLVKLAMRSSPPSASGKKRGQVVRTMPAYKAVPMGEKGCMELYQRAIRNAEKYIYIEDQYFRSPIIAKELATAVRKNPNLILVVVTQPDMFADIEWAGIGIGTLTTYWTHDAFLTIRKELPNFCLFELIVNDVDASGTQLYVRVNTHAKLMIVDDEWYTIGSCNLNDRGFLFEGEINIGVADAEDAFKLRMQLFSDHLQTPCPAKIEDAVKLWYDHAAKNVAAMKAKTKPVSRVFSFAQGGPLLPIAPRTYF
jgi:cardiolipin synthase